MIGQNAIKVLVVEDDYLLSAVTKAVLEQGGYEVVGKANNGLEAISMTASLKPDVVIMDVAMPNMNGIEAARQIQIQCPTPIVILTAYEKSTWIQQASEAGAGAYLVKPLNVKELERAITIAMARFADMMALRRLNSELQARNEDLDAFAHTVAHDLQDPLSIMIGYAELLNLTADMPPEYKNYTDAIIKMGRKMNTIIRELILLSKIHQLEIQPEPLDMVEVLTEAQTRLADLITQSHAEIIAPKTWPTVWGHTGWIEEIWANYLSNAIKYGGCPPKIELGATVLPDKQQVHFWVRDNGRGLTQAQQAQLFKPFTRLHTNVSKGTGLGLSIVRRIVEKLGGQVTLQSQLDQGSCFGFTLPLMQKKATQPLSFATAVLKS